MTWGRHTLRDVQQVFISVILPFDFLLKFAFLVALKMISDAEFTSLSELNSMLTDPIFHVALPIKFGWSSPPVIDRGRRRLIDTRPNIRRFFRFDTLDSGVLLIRRANVNNK